MSDLLSKEGLPSVVSAAASISTAWSSSLFSFTNFSETKIAAAEPSEVGEHYNLVKGL
jgi:hypothetical protein